jgi:DNA (cytosine-5)-methyltransferase 1
VTAQALDAADFGVPQTRKRLFFIGIHSSLAGQDTIMPRGSGATRALALQRKMVRGRISYEPVELEPELWEKPFLDKLFDPENETFVTAEQAIGDLVTLKVGERRDSADLVSLKPAVSAFQRRMREGNGLVLENTSVPRVNADTVLRLAKLPPGGNYRDLPDALRKRYLTGELWGPHNGSGRLGRRHYYAYRRLHPSIWSWTLNTKADSVYHYAERRALSVREFARLQSFPDRFVFTTDPRRGELKGRIDGGAAHSRYRQVGNAVPPLLALAIARAVADVLRTPQAGQASG